ncbi:MAG: VacJ family lipoprotein [Pseudomonadota bacterium]|nr:VacJ family lipoprotein [Pseudomonadota bacterium]
MSGEHRSADKRIPSWRSWLIAGLAFVFLAGGCAHGPKQAQTTQTRLTIDSAASRSALPPPESGASVRTEGREVSVAAPATPVAAPSANVAPLSPAAAAARTEPTSSPTAAHRPEVGAQKDGEEAAGEADRDLEGDFLASDDEEEADPAAGPREEALTIADPWEPFNRAMYRFNDRLYFWVLKPAARGYAKALPEGVRIGIRNVFVNIAFPVRFVNCLLQLDLSCAAVETGRFVINSVWGLGGLFDVASDEAINLPRQRRDLGQTLGIHGIGPGFFINWPIIGPSSPRDTIGLMGDILMDPLAWVPPWYAATGIAAGYRLNETSLNIGDYEALKEAAIDPYVAIRDAYVQHRYHRIKQVMDRK